MPPLRFIQQRRLARAREMLSQRTLSVSDVSAEVGYRDPSHFAALFRREFGVSPAEFRRSLPASAATDFDGPTPGGLASMRSSGIER